MRGGGVYAVGIGRNPVFSLKSRLGGLDLDLQGFYITPQPWVDMIVPVQVSKMVPLEVLG